MWLLCCCFYFMQTFHNAVLFFTTLCPFEVLSYICMFNQTLAVCVELSLCNTLTYLYLCNHSQCHNVQQPPTGWCFKHCRLNNSNKDIEVIHILFVFRCFVCLNVSVMWWQSLCRINRLQYPYNTSNFFIVLVCELFMLVWRLKLYIPSLRVSRF